MPETSAKSASQDTKISAKKPKLTKSVKIQLAILLAVLGFTAYQCIIFFANSGISLPIANSQEPQSKPKLNPNPLDYTFILTEKCCLPSPSSAKLKTPSFAFKFGNNGVYACLWSFSCDIEINQAIQFYKAALLGKTGITPTKSTRDAGNLSRICLAAGKNLNNRLCVTLIKNRDTNRIVKIDVVNFCRPDLASLKSASSHAPSYLKTLTKDLPANYRPLDPTKTKQIKYNQSK